MGLFHNLRFMEPIFGNSAVDHYWVETYALFTNVDEQILKFNTIVEPLGYTFIAVNLTDIERNFSALLSLPAKYESNAKISISGRAGFLTNEFYEALMNNPNFGVNLLSHGRAILLKRTEDYKQDIIEDRSGLSVIDLDTSPMFKASQELHEFLEDLILNFRLIKTGDPDYLFQFQITKESRRVVSRKSRANGRQFNVRTFDFSALELTELKLRMQSGMASKVRVNELTQLALSNFILSYEIIDLKTRFVTLTTALESLFNNAKGEITHVISRHLALIVSTNKPEFASNYKHVKKLYAIRTSLVHGAPTPKDLVSRLQELEDYVRKAINYCIQLDPSEVPTAAILFEWLNAAGYSA
jgi:hypothetical protein